MPPCRFLWVWAYCGGKPILSPQGGSLTQPLSCASCQSTVIPVKRYKWWAITLWLIFFWPGAIIYALTRNADNCPACKDRVYSRVRPPTSQSVSLPQEQTTSPGNGKPKRSGVLKKAVIGVGAGAGLIIVLLIILVAVSGDDIAEDNEEYRQTKEEKQKGFHCLSAWDGNHDSFEELVKAKLKDPNSMETYETRISPVNAQGKHTILMDYGARNSFGGMVRGTARGTVDNETCEATLLNVE